MFEQIQLGDKPKFDSNAYAAYDRAVAFDELIAEAWDGRNLADADAKHDSHHTLNEYHAAYKNKDGEYYIYSFTHIGYIPAIAVTAEKLERAHTAEPESIHVEHCGWHDSDNPQAKAMEWWNTHVISRLASRVGSTSDVV